MNKQLSIAEVENLFQSIVDKPVMTRREKLLRWAGLVRDCTHDIFIFDGLEYLHPDYLRMTRHSRSAFALAAADPQFKAAGLKGDSARDAMNFFELTQCELHEFSCNCGGNISNNEMAWRIEYLAR